jgi:hypothetical protein
MSAATKPPKDGKLVHIEWEGSLYRGWSRAWPREVWSARKRTWMPYRGEVPKDIDWGTEITAEDAVAMMSAPAPGFFMAFPAKRLILLRLSADAPAAFFNPKTLQWCPWRTEVPATAEFIDQRDAFRLMSYDYRRLDFGQIAPDWRNWPTALDP